MRWMMYRWWCEDGGDKAWWVIESVFLCSPDKGFWASTPRHAQTAGNLGFAMQFNAETLLHSHSSAFLGRIVSIVTKGKVTPFFPREKPNVKHSIAGYLRLPRPTPASALMRLLGTPLAICPSIMTRYEDAASSLWWLLQTSASVQCHKAFNRWDRSLMTLSGWGRKVLL